MEEYPDEIPSWRRCKRCKLWIVEWRVRRHRQCHQNNVDAWYRDPQHAGVRPSWLKD